MNTVSIDKAQELRDNGWVKETYFIWLLFHDRWLLIPKAQDRSIPSLPWLPTPTANKLGEDLSYEDLREYFIRNVLAEKYPVKEWLVTYWSKFSRWLYTTLLDPDAMAEVWVKVRTAHDEPIVRR